MKEREDIEKSDRDQRWEFDRKRLFETTQYMEDRCGELHEIASILEYYHAPGARPSFSPLTQSLTLNSARTTKPGLITLSCPFPFQIWYGRTNSPPEPSQTDTFSVH